MRVFLEEEDRRAGQPRTEEERRTRHAALYGPGQLPPRGTGLAVRALGVPIGLWEPVDVVLVTGLRVRSVWVVENVGEVEAEVYMELGVIRPMFWGDLPLVATLPNGRFRTEMDRPELVAAVDSPVVAVAPGQEVVVGAAVALAPEATPPPVTLNVAVRVRYVIDPNAALPSRVGEPVANGVYTQAHVIWVIAPPQPEYRVERAARSVEIWSPRG